MIWKILEIEKTKDEEVIRNAYREKLRLVNPEDDQQGFMELRQAYEEALAYAKRPETEEEVDGTEPEFKGKKNDVDLWIDKVDIIYCDVKTRIQEDKWKELLKDSVCDNLDTELEAGEKLLAYFMSHSNMPQSIWQLVDKRFGYIENMEHLKEKFPENYLEFVKWQINRPGFIDYELFGGETDKDVDAYINKIYELKAVSEERDLDKVKQLLKELKRFDVTHPFTETEEARCILLEAELIAEKLNKVEENDGKQTEPVLNAQERDELEEERKQLLKAALSIMEELDFEYSSNQYIERIYAETLIENGKIESAKAIYQALLDADEKNYTAMLGMANCVFLEGNPEEAKEQVEDVLEDRVQDADSLTLLDKINLVLVERYETELEKELIPDVCYKLGWCYYQQKKFEEGIQLLDQLEASEEYDYINLRCRLYLAGDHYREALPFAQKWLELIEQSEDDGSKEAQKRKNRLSLAHFSIGICYWENEFKNAAKDDKDSIIERVKHYIETAIQEENNTLVKFSYMEQLARFYLEAERYEACIEMCDSILERDRGFFPAYVHRQKAHYKLKHAKEVIDDYFACIEIYPAYVPPYVLAAEVFYAFDQYDDVEQVIGAARELELESDSLDLYEIRCVHYKAFSKENTEKALALMEQLRDKIYSSKERETDIEEMAELEKEYAILYWDLDDTARALNIIEEYLVKQPDNTTMLHLKVDVLNREKRIQEALDICERLVQLEPDNLYAKTRVGNSYERLDNTNKAIACYKEILSIDPKYAPALRRMMYIHSYLSNENDDLSQCATAVEYASRFIEVTNAAEGYVERGNLYIDLYELEKAVDDCKMAIDLDSDAYYAYNNLGCALLKLRRIEEAIVPLEQAIAMDPDKDHLPYLNLAECYTLAGEYDKAVKMYYEVIRIRPKATHLRRDIANVYLKAGKYDKAIKIYVEMLEEVKKEKKERSISNKISSGITGKLTEMDKKEQKLYCDIAEAYHQMGDIVKAEDYYFKVEPGHYITKQICAKAISDVAEYYRDKGDLDKADRILFDSIAHSSSDEHDTQDKEHLDFVRATVCFEKGDAKHAKHWADQFLKAFLKRHNGEEEILRDERYRRMFLYVLVVMHMCAGRISTAKEYLAQMKPCHLCVTCEYQDCYEYYLAEGLIAELEGDKEKAMSMYKQTIENKKNCYTARRHLKCLEEKM